MSHGAFPLRITHSALRMEQASGSLLSHYALRVTQTSMPKFTYISRDTRGQRVTAIAEAPTRQELLGQLKDRGLTVVEVKELDLKVQAAPGKRARMSLSRVSFDRINTGEL